jgi:sugar transferase (PEP-CTERM system associated)
VVRVFNVYYPLRVLVLLVGEGLIICASFVVAAMIRFGSDSSFVLRDENGLLKIFGITAVALISFHYFDLYDAERVSSPGETYVRLLLVLGAVSFLLGVLGYLFPDFLMGQNVILLGIALVTIALFAWRRLYLWLIDQPMLRERVYVLGSGERAKRLVEALRSRRALGMDVVGWAGAVANGSLQREELGRQLLELKRTHAAERVIVAMADGRGVMPVRELLDLRLNGVKVEDATTLLEKISGRIETHELHPSWLIFSEGFPLHTTFLATRRIISLVVAFTCLLLTLPLWPLIILAIELSSPGQVLYRQKRVGRNGVVFTCYKFRTMRPDAEADTGPTWALDDDPRITRVGRALRYLRLDEIPQLWNVLRGDMGFIGPRPERPEFVEWLSQEIPYYHLRHIIRPGITGWAQIRYKYGNTVEDARQKLQYDLFYIKNMSVGLDLWILVETIKVICLGRGAQ